MSDTTIQQNVAQYLRELADKVERSRWCTIESSGEERKYFQINTGKRWDEKFPTGEREVALKLNYIEERL